MIVCVPSRSRPASLRRLIEHCRGTKAKFWLRLDEDDPRLREYLFLSLPLNWHRVIGPRARAAAAMRELFSAEPNADTYLLLGDDTIPRTPKWDVELEKSALETGMSYPDDGIHGPTKVTHPVVSGALLRELGFWTLPDLTHLFTDTVLEYIGQQLGCLTYRGDIVLEHLHFSTGKSPFDETYRRVDNGRDEACYKNWIASPQTHTLIARLKSTGQWTDAVSATQ
jgi:hypothetical protein